MRFIHKKRTPPISFIDIVTSQLDTPGNNGYNSLGYKKPDLLNILIEEQNGLCAYCNQKITAKSATIEHLVCQSHNPNYDLNYHNLFAVCNGNEGKIDTSHCDKFRANKKKNDYFLPFILFDKCLTTSWTNMNPFFDIEFNKRSGVVSGKLIAKETNIPGYPTIKTTIEYAINTLNLNAPILLNARKEKWDQVLVTKNKTGLNWQDLFDYYLKSSTLTDFYEFVLLAIRKQ